MAINEYEVLFICAANVGRSQIAEGFYNHYRGDRKAISAAAKEDKREKYSFRPHPGVTQVMQEKGIDISSQIVKLLTPNMIGRAKIIVMLCGPESCPDYLLKAQNLQITPVDDGYVLGSDPVSELMRFRTARDNIEAIVIALIKELGHEIQQ